MSQSLPTCLLLANIHYHDNNHDHYQEGDDDDDDDDWVDDINLSDQYFSPWRTTLMVVCATPLLPEQHLTSLSSSSALAQPS